MLKRGQSEDIFNDLIPALILIIVTVVIIAINSYSETSQISSISENDFASLHRLDLITYMRMPASIYDSFAEYLLELDSGNEQARHFTKGVNPYECTSGLEEELRYKISYSQWSLRAFDSVSGDLIFSCFSDNDFFTDAYSLYTVDAQEAVLGASLFRDLEPAYFGPLGMKYLNTTLPSASPSRDIVVKMGVMLDE